VSDHRDFDYQTIGKHAKLILDTRNAMKAVSNPKGRIVKL